MHSLTTRLQDTFVKSKVLTNNYYCNLESLRSIPNWNASQNNKARKHAACKLAASHLVRISLNARRKAVAGLLGVKRDVMDAPLTCIKDLGDRWHTDSREPYFYEAGYTTTTCLNVRTLVVYPVSRSQCMTSPLRYR